MNESGPMVGISLRLPRQQWGGALLLTMVILGAFLVMAIAAVGLVNRQFREIVNQTQEEQAFQVAEAGRGYAFWLLDNDLVDLQNPQPVNDYPVTIPKSDPEEVVGTFDVSFVVVTNVADGPVTVEITVVGVDAVLVDRPQTIKATAYSPNGGADWRMVEWHHEV